jgi:hypothetical protein
MLTFRFANCHVDKPPQQWDGIDVDLIRSVASTLGWVEVSSHLVFTDGQEISIKTFVTYQADNLLCLALGVLLNPGSLDKHLPNHP